MCAVLDQKYSPVKLQELLRKATLLDSRYRGHFIEAAIISDTKDELLKEMMEMTKEGQEEGGKCTIKLFDKCYVNIYFKLYTYR